MAERADTYRRRADDCDTAAARVTDPDVRSVYLDMAGCWRRMAEQQEQIDGTLAAPRKSAE